MSRPTVITLCGSRRFEETFHRVNEELTLAGVIVLTVGAFHHDVTPQQKRDLDDLHKRKIDLSDGIHVLNVDGYIGESTVSEISYALDHGKVVTYLEPRDPTPKPPPPSPPPSATSLA